MKTKNNKKRLEKLGRYVAYILRHNPQELDAKGWAHVDNLLRLAANAGYALTNEDLAEVVATDEKSRFVFNKDKTQVRALQGHSFAVELDLVNVQPPSLLFHGTATRHLDGILASGLTKQTRHAVHLSASAATAVNVGSRHGKPVVLTIDTRQMHQDGHAFQCTQNGVWLTESVPAQYISVPVDN